ncbi:MAG: 50S ribosomal protein L29 [Bacteroidetes bacterium]|nr:50S ribosomal protein L29 [Bacteroidota bacterium]MBS1629088.1 50S ribosomal protein L29 [Bacteroidota bacterium]
MKKNKKADTHDYRTWDDAALANNIAEEEMRLKKLHFSHAVNPIENPLSIRSLRRRIAQMKTEQTKRQLAK